MFQQYKCHPHYTNECNTVQSASDEVVDIIFPYKGVEFLDEDMIIAVLHRDDCQKRNSVKRRTVQRNEIRFSVQKNLNR